MKKKDFAIWLMPCKNQKLKLNKTILFLSKKYKSPVFELHLTIYAGESFKLKNLMKNVRKIKLSTIKLSTIKLKTQKILDTNDLFKSLYVTTSKNKSLKKLLKKLNIKLDLEIKVEDPHISLMYKQIEKSKIKNIKRKLKNTIPKYIYFCQLAIVIPYKNKWENVEEWKIIKLG